MKVILKTKKDWPKKGERVRFCGLAYYVSEADPPKDGTGGLGFVTVCDVQPTDAGRGPLMHEAELISEIVQEAP